MEGPTLTRRHAFKLAGLAGAAAALKGRTSLADGPATMPGGSPTTSPAALPQGAGFYRTHVGNFEVTVVSDGAFAFGAAFPTFGSNASEAAVTAALKNAFLAPTGLMGQVNTLLIREGDGPYTLLDTGCGKLFGPLTGFAKQNMQAAGVSPADVKTVLLTHLHPDHAGGAAGEDFKPTFAGARHYVHEDEHQFWTGPSPDFSKSGVPKEMQSGMIAGAKVALSAAGTSLSLFAGDEHAIAPGITALRTGGHTPGHCAVRIESDGESMVYVTDLIVQSVLVLAHPEWFVGFDTDMAKTVEVRRAMFAKWSDERTLICGSHLPFPSIGHIKRADLGYQFYPTPWRWA